MINFAELRGESNWEQLIHLKTFSSLSESSLSPGQDTNMVESSFYCIFLIVETIKKKLQKGPSFKKKNPKTGKLEG